MMKLVAKTLYGLEDILADEVRLLGARDVNILNRAISFSGDEKLLYQANYCLRTALSILRVINQFNIRSSNDLYLGAKKIDWDRFMDPGKTFSVAPVVKSSIFKHTGFAGLVLKDAIADWFRERTGKRPSVNTVNPDLVLNLHVSNDNVTVSADSSVIPLFKRGWRVEQGPAPINEVLAAGMVINSGWNKQDVFVDPMCGSGTIAIEAALISGNIPPGKFRSFFGFQKWNDYSQVLFEEIKAEYDGKIIWPEQKIYASDISGISVSRALANVKAAGLSEIIKVEKKDFRHLKAPGEKGVIIINPPYGERLKIDEADGLYDMIGSALKHGFPGFSAWIITPAVGSLKKIGLRPLSKKILFNGPLECTLARYDLYSGTRKTKPTGS